MTPVLDTNRLAELGADLGDVEFLRETVGIYLSELPARRTVMQAEFAADNRAGLRAGAHSLGSASAMLGAIELQEISLVIERRAIDAPVAEISALFRQWQRSCELAQSALQGWLADQGSNR